MTDPPSVAAHYGAVYRFVRRRARSLEDAEDVTQDVFLAAIVALNQARLRESEPSLAWLYTVAQRRLMTVFADARLEWFFHWSRRQPSSRSTRRPSCHHWSRP